MITHDYLCDGLMMSDQVSFNKRLIADLPPIRVIWKNKLFMNKDQIRLSSRKTSTGRERLIQTRLIRSTT